ncbi:MAG: hypothetical protein J0I41_23560, partial [Filimonas sp.]|nr:hypothetical protein [Filimonas sp.]
LNAYNDRNFFGGDNGDRWWTGGASITIVNLMGNKDNMLRFGNDVFTGNSFPRMASSAKFDEKMPFYTYSTNKPPLNYAGQMFFDQPGRPGFNQSLNMGQTYLSMNMGCDLFLIKHVGKFDMWSQNTIHDLTGFHRFLSTVPDQFMVTGGLGTSHNW